MLCDEVGSTGMETTGKEAGHDEVAECPQSHKLDNDHIEYNLNHEVDQVPYCRRLVPYESWPKGVEQYLERAAHIEVKDRTLLMIARHTQRKPSQRHC